MLTGKQFGRYRIGRKIGEGGMGEVYIAHDDELDRSVAIKLLPREFLIDEDRSRRFRQEARSVSALNHPNIITIYEIGENEHGSFLVTELIDGRTLRDVINSETLSLPLILRIVEQMANALVAAHSAKIVHRDIKPENIMLRQDAIVKILDFGLAKPYLPLMDDGDGKQTLPGTVMGSARYMSPEQARGREVDARTDIWSLGVVLYEMLTGRAPFDGETSSETLANVIHKEPEQIGHGLPNLPAELQRILRKALEKDRDERYQTSRDFALDIKNLLYDLDHSISGNRAVPVTSSPDFTENQTMIHMTSGANQPTDKSSVLTWKSASFAMVDGRRRSTFATLAAIVLVGLLGVGGYIWYGRSHSQLAATAFDKTQISRINSDGKVHVPAMSPDGKYIAYVSGEVGNRSIMVRQLSTESEVQVVPPTALGFATVTFSPSGDYVFYTQTSRDYSLNTLYQVPTLGGASKKLVEDVDSQPTFSPDGKKMAFRRNVSQTGENVIFTVNSDGSNLSQLISGKPRGFDFLTTPAWSPDGTKILFGAGKSHGGVRDRVVLAEVSVVNADFDIINPKEWNNIDSLIWFKDGSGILLVAKDTSVTPMQIWRVAYPSGTATAITNDVNSYSGLAVSADGSRMITTKSDPVSSIWKYSVGSREIRQIAPDSPKLEGGSGIAETPDGKLIYSSDEGFEKNLWISDGDGKNARRLTSEAKINQTPEITPDGRFIIFNSSRSGSFGVWRMEADGKNPVQLTDENSDTSDFNPIVTADGKSVIFSRNYVGDSRGSTILRVSVDGGTALPLVDDSEHSSYAPQLSPDGKHLLFTSYNLKTYERKIQVVPFDGNAVGAIEKSFVFDLVNTVRWSPDGKSLTYWSGVGIPNLWRLPLDTDKPEQMTDFKSGRIFNYGWSRDGKNIFVVRAIVNSDLIMFRDLAYTPR